MNLNGTIKKTQALSGRLVKSSGGGGSVQEIYWVQFGVGTATNAEVNEAVAANKLPICYWDSTDAYGRPRRTLYFLIRNTPTESFFSGVDYINNTIIVRRLYADAWDTQTIRYEGKLTWDTTPRFGSQNPVTSGGIYQALQDVTVSDERIAEAVDDWLSVQAPSIGTLSYAAKQALLACFRHVAWIDDQGQSYYNALESELFPDATLESITAVFTQGQNVITNVDSLDSLRQYLVVTATYADSTTGVISGYDLSGTLAIGTDTITVTYGGKTDTFTVTVSDSGYLYYWDFTDSLIDRVQGQTAVLNNISNAGITANGILLSFDTIIYDTPSRRQGINLGNVFGRGKSIEIDLRSVDNSGSTGSCSVVHFWDGVNTKVNGSYNCFGYHYSTTAANNRYGIVTSDAQHWAFNANTSIGTKNYLDGTHTVRIEISANGEISAYKDGVDLNAVYPVTVSGAKPTISDANAAYPVIGTFDYTLTSDGGYAQIQPAIVSGARIRNLGV